MRPKVSVLMAVYNAEDFLAEAMESILNQTFKDFEFIIIDDGSTDSSKKIIRNYSDPRIRLISRKNKGFVFSLNEGIELARGKYIARMDADDISDPTRIEKQVKFLDKNRDIAMVGTSFSLVDEKGNLIDHSYHLDRPEDLVVEIFTRNPFGHGTTMIKSSVLKEVGMYSKDEPIEDYDLWWRISRKYSAANLTDELYNWRIVSSGMSHGSSRKRQRSIHNLMVKIWRDNPPSPSLEQIKSGLGHYGTIGPEYREQYMYMLAALYLAALKMRRPAYASRLLVKLFLADVQFRKVIHDLKNNPLSHNYILTTIYRD